MKTFYVFDDNEITLEDFRDIASQLGCSKSLFSCSDEQGSLAIIDEFKRSGEEPIFVVDMNIDTRDSGIRILEAIRDNEALKESPVIVITSSQEQDTINECYERGANAFYQKNDSPEGFSQDIKAMMVFWAAASVHDNCKVR
jgi:CheY-like chemotaxis protein